MIFSFVTQVGFRPYMGPFLCCNVAFPVSQFAEFADFREDHNTALPYHLYNFFL